MEMGRFTWNSFASLVSFLVECFVFEIKWSKIQNGMKEEKRTHQITDFQVNMYSSSPDDLQFPTFAAILSYYIFF